MTKEDLFQLMTNIMFDDELEHLQVKDVKHMFGHLSPFIHNEEEVEEDEDIERHIL